MTTPASREAVQRGMRERIRALEEIVYDFLANEECSCVCHEHPCPRCKVTIDEAREIMKGIFP